MTEMNNFIYNLQILFNDIFEILKISIRIKEFAN